MRFLIAILVCALCGLSRADVRLPAIFGSHMVLQSGTNTPVWGRADPGEKVTVRIGASELSAAAGADGMWNVTFSGLVASDTPVTVTVAGHNAVTFEDVLIGDVWVCSGQSNMALPVRRVLGRDGGDAKGLGQVNHPQIRLFKLPKETILLPQADCRGSWSVCTPAEAKEFSAAGYFFGREIQRAEKIPVGLINACRGGSSGQMWASLEGLQSEPALSSYVRETLAARAEYPQQKERYVRERAKWKEDTAQWPGVLKRWEADAAKARAEGKAPPGKPVPPGDAPARPAGMDAWEDNVMASPTVLFNGMIAPLLPFGIKGVIWYQGEGNADTAGLYKTLFPALIRDWRRLWARGDFPFYFVQLSSYLEPRDQPGESNWAALREAQCMTLRSATNTGMAVTIDIGNAHDIHPLSKEEVGRRLSLIALANTYGRRIEFSGPVYDRMEVSNGVIRLHFTHSASGLVSKGGGELKRFAIAGADRKFVWGSARIAGGAVEVSSPDVRRPVAVRYAWAINPDGANLFNGEGLPASPFRTDDWPLAYAPSQ